MNRSYIQIAVFSSQSLFCTGITLSLSKFDNLQITMACQYSPIALNNLIRLLPDVIIVDVDDDVNKSLEIINAIQSRLSGPSILVMSSNETDSSRLSILPDIIHYPKSITAEDLCVAIMKSVNPQYDAEPMEESRPDSIIAEKGGVSITAENTLANGNLLTAREREVLGYVALGYLNKQIADILGISTETIKNHITSSLRKLQATSRTDAVVQAIRKGLITIN